MALRLQDFENPLFRTRVYRRNVQGGPAFEGTTFTNEYVRVGFTCIIATGMLSVVNIENQLLFSGKIASDNDFEKALKKADRKQKEIYLGKTKPRVINSTEALRLLAGKKGEKKAAAPRKTPEPAKPAKEYKKGDTVTMLFHGAGVTSKEKHKVLLVKGNVITVDDGDEEDRRRFDVTTGKCLNDNNFMGFSREIEL